MFRTITHLIIFLSLFGLACKSTSTSIEVLQPAEIFIPEHIETIVTIDRSKPAKGFLSFLEGAFSGEEIGQDKEGRIQALNGLTEALTRTPRFKVVHSGYQKTGANASLRLIEPMNWYEVKALCEEFNADAVLAIEMYDSDLVVETQERERKRKNKDGEEYTETYFRDDMDMAIKMGWRLYDPKTGTILDEFTTRDEDGGNAEGATEEKARANLPDPFQMGREISFIAGQLYGERIAPTWVSVNRSYYQTVKGAEQNDMERAVRMAKTKDWRGAAKVWTHIVQSSSNEETRGKAAYNIAVANECLGKLQVAKDWAQRAYVEFNNKKAKNYVNTIDQRIYERQLVEEQLRGKS
ncbi:MAG: DUF6340 family protein [Bacteroidota bacterium]